MFDELDSIHNGNITVEPEPCPYEDNYRQDGYMYVYPEPPKPYETWEEADDLIRTRGY